MSSTLTECATERTVVRDAIRSLNHEPVLFEDVGARPHPPRDVYASRLEISHIFIGIYKERYGWIAPEMNISGVEDEFRIAAARGMDRLIYVYRTPASRDQRLHELIEEAKGAGITLAMYSEPAQLESRVRNDLTAVMSNRFVSQLVVSQEAGKADETLGALLPERAHRFRRRAVEDALVHKVATIGRAAVTAPLGGGKTILTAQVAVREGWIFVESRGLNRLGVMARVANALRQRVGQPPVMLTSEDDAIREALERWEDVPDVTVVVDEAGNPRGLWEIIPQNRRLVITSRGVGGIPSAMRLQVPPLTREELTSWVAVLKGRRPDPGDIVQLETASAGNPLYLRLFALGAETSADLTLRQLELRAVQELPAEAREIVSYLALSPRQLRLADLQSLLGAGGERPQTVARQLAAANGILEQRRGAVGLVHEHLRETVVDELHGDSIRLSFFASRLGRFFEKCRDPLAAFHVYLEADEQRHSDRVLDRAAHQAVVMGGGAPAIPVLRRQAKLAEERGDGEEQLRATLLLAGALRQTGAATEARGALDEARIIANSVATPTESLWIPEVEAALRLDDRTRSERIAQLEGLQRQCVERGDALAPRAWEQYWL